MVPRPGRSSPSRHSRNTLHFHPTLLLLPLVLVLALLLQGAHSFVPRSPSTSTSTRAAMASSSSALSAAGGEGSGSSDGKESLLNPLLSSVAVSKTIEIHAMTKNMEARGEAVVSLCVGEPDFPPPAGTFVGSQTGTEPEMIDCGRDMPSSSFCNLPGLEGFLPLTVKDPP